MSITKEFLKELGVTEEAADKIFAERGKEIEADKKKLENYETALAEIKTLKEDLETAKETIKAAEGLTGDKKELEDELKKYRDAEEVREKAEAEAQKTKLYTDSLEELLNGREFANEFTGDTIIKKIRELHEADSTKGVEHYFKQLTEGKDGVFKSQNPSGAQIPPVNADSQGEEVKKPNPSRFI